MAEEPLAHEMHRPQGRGPSTAIPTRQLDLLSSLYDTMPVGMAVWSVEGVLSRANAVFADLMNSTADALVGRRFDSFIDPTEVGTVRRHLAELLAGERNYLECDFECCRPDGVDHWVTNLLTAVYGPNGRPDHLISQIFDFSNPRTREARAHRLVNETPVLLWLTDRSGLPRIGNRTCFEFVGISPEEEDLGTAFVDRMHADDLAELS
ncbi:MAG TPA: PAS domain-containing protein, partial [Acidimicrobiales bacterium]|nr:PAS domain-containing protein [Acidimicrobiales bacterium]